MKLVTSKLLIFIVVTGLASCTTQNKESDLDLNNFKKEQVTVEDFESWDFYGMGKAFNAGGNQFCLTENDSTLGVVLISPKSYKGDVVVRYKTLALTSASVLVFMHSVSDSGDEDNLNIPEDYNGNMGIWIKEKENYFYAFKNASHNFTPFIRKYPIPGNEALVAAPENIMIPGKYYAIEIGRVGNKLWLNIDGEKVLEATDNEIYPGGHLVFRIRGTAGFKAACLIKDMEIYSNAN